MSACLTDAMLPNTTPMEMDISWLSFNISWRPAIEHDHDGYDQLAALSDSHNKTCMSLDHNLLSGSHALFVGSLPVAYKSLRVTLKTSTRSLHFQGGSTCSRYSSSLLSHVGPKSGPPCRPFCGVPTTCNLVERQGTYSRMVTFHFECLCAAQKCTEILLWLWEEPGAEIPAKICEVEVAGYD